MLGVWQTKAAAVGEDFSGKQMARMSDPALKTEDDAHWQANAWTPNNTDGHMNQAQYSAMMDVMAAREDSLFGAHVTWTPEDRAAQYTEYCGIFGADTNVGLSY